MRGRGLGAALLHEAVAGLIAQGTIEVSLNVASDNVAAIALYQKLGFATYDEMRTYQRVAGQRHSPSSFSAGAKPTDS